MTAVVQGVFNGAGKKIGIVAGRFNELITSKLLDGALDCLERHGVNMDDVAVCWVPGSFEIPAAAKRLARSKKYDAVICLGTVIRGSTPHFDCVASTVSKGVAKISLDEDLPVIFGVLTTDTIEQAVERAGTKAGNKGWDAALSALEMADLFTKI
jgi:6,7-dimethyl-8-ribityllumazine synthase